MTGDIRGNLRDSLGNPYIPVASGFASAPCLTPFPAAATSQTGPGSRARPPHRMPPTPVAAPSARLGQGGGTGLKERRDRTALCPPALRQPDIRQARVKPPAAAPGRHVHGQLTWRLARSGRTCSQRGSLGCFW